VNFRLPNEESTGHFGAKSAAPNNGYFSDLDQRRSSSNIDQLKITKNRHQNSCSYSTNSLPATPKVSGRVNYELFERDLLADAENLKFTTTNSNLGRNSENFISVKGNRVVLMINTFNNHVFKGKVVENNTTITVVNFCEKQGNPSRISSQNQQASRVGNKNLEIWVRRRNSDDNNNEIAQLVKKRDRKLRHCSDSEYSYQQNTQMTSVDSLQLKKMIEPLHHNYPM